MQRAQRISDIIKKRKPLVQKIEAVQGNLNSLRQALRSLEENRDELVGRVDDKAIAGRLRAIEVGPLQQEIESELRSLGKLKTRFSRNTLNIAVVGRAGQGKSRLLQSLTGLTGLEIPDGSHGHCTGVRSIIVHNPESDAPFADVSFYTERSFLDEVISPYHKELELSPKPNNLEQFSNSPLPPLPQDKDGATDKAKYEHLRRYHGHFDEYENLLNSARLHHIPRDKIREYVAQNDKDGNRKYNYLAVREVKITCRFPNDDIGQIALVDLPGLGDTSVGGEERLIATLSQDADLVLFVKRPEPGAAREDREDNQLYDMARSALRAIPLEKWSFMVFNRTESNEDSRLGDNLKECEFFSRRLPDSGMNVSGDTIANCADEKEVKTEILDPILEHLDGNITELDNQYASECQTRLERLRLEIATELEKARTALGEAKPDIQEHDKFNELFNNLSKKMAQGLEELLRTLRDQSEEQGDERDREFADAIEKIIQSCSKDAGIPSEEDIRGRRATLGSLSSAYDQYLNEVRAHLSQKFLSLDEGFDRSLNQVKSQVADVLRTHGRLEKRTDAKGAKFLEEAASTLIPDRLSKIKYGFQILSEFRLSYRGFVQHRIRKCLNGLTPDKQTKLKLPQDEKQTRDYLEVLHREAVSECEYALQDILFEPYAAHFTIVEEFIDRVLRAEGVKEEWRSFLYQERSAIWPEEFQLLGE